jgi:hypothetical protein
LKGNSNLAKGAQKGMDKGKGRGNRNSVKGIDKGKGKGDCGYEDREGQGKWISRLRLAKGKGSFMTVDDSEMEDDDVMNAWHS